MRFEAVQNNPDYASAINGTSLKGYVQVDYDTLETLFGQPTEGDGYKTDAEWLLVGDDGTIASIYNWKNGRNYEGRGGYNTFDITDWHIGGHDMKAVSLVYEALGLVPELEEAA